jgi:hypothetical protein
MTYTKPEVLLLGRAVDAVQAHAKGPSNQDIPGSQSTSAYEADE